MGYRLFGNSGLRVAELCLGTMTFGEGHWGASADESRRIFDTYAAAGGNFIDTANVYAGGASEALVGEFTRAERQRFVVATKYSLTERPRDPNGGGNHRKSLVQSVENSLRRLGTDYLDILWVHAWDFMTPEQEVMRALDDLIRAGKIFYIGVSDTPAWVVAASNTLAELRGWSAFCGLQIPYSLVERTPEREYFGVADRFGLTVTVWGALGFGLLSGKYNGPGGAGAAEGRIAKMDWAAAALNERSLEIAREVSRIANDGGVSPTQVALSWVRQKSARVIPVVGARTARQLADNLGCLDCKIGAADMQRLEELSGIALGFPYDFLWSPVMVATLFGEMRDRIAGGAP